ncbi:PLP-dependent cysteine synthase family protein [Paraliomyxa miuraensis]|uniref:PLP-dependent cysteine synthase family protein n=1 Tax=Paraliomyxa miuraensis TaxID=376150 RepID=UPI002256EB35|nr:cysteine synthase family protein [Paraliomyxa miuraensis]MCX4245691.1 cysteine synthase family protein [Paraliomyxa miuraensis]
MTIAARTSEPAPPPAVVSLHQQQALRRPARVGSIVELVGNTPLVRLGRIDRRTPGVEIWAKCEFANPGGSVKDRAAYRIIADALARGDLRPGIRLIDSTSGNTGIAYSMVGAALGIPITLVMPSNVSNPRKQVTAAFGTELRFSDPMEGSDGAIVEARAIVDADPRRWYYPNQYANDSNWRAHYDGTAREILAQTDGRITHFVTGIGTSGTIMGTSRRLHEHDPGIRCIGLQPDDAMHGLEGLKHIPSSLVPPIYDESVLDDTIWLPTDEGWDMSDRLASDEGLFVGHSSGANVAGALRVAKELHGRGESGLVVTVLCDRGDRYFAPLQWEKHYVW